MQLLTSIIDQSGLSKAAECCGVRYQAVRKWQRRGLPRTEFTGETDYAGVLARLYCPKVSDQAAIRSRLLEETRSFLLQRRHSQQAAA